MRNGLLGRGMTVRIATWNINSVRLRIDQVARFVLKVNDVLKVI
jgi:exonuclease III